MKNKQDTLKFPNSQGRGGSLDFGRLRGACSTGGRYVYQDEDRKGKEAMQSDCIRISRAVGCLSWMVDLPIELSSHPSALWVGELVLKATTPCTIFEVGKITHNLKGIEASILYIPHPA